jgi:hypothetical protein
VFVALAEFRHATSIGAVDYTIFQLMCHRPSEQCRLANASAFTCGGYASRKEDIAVNAGVYKNNVLLLLKGNAPSNLGHELTTENTQMKEEWNRRHDDIAVYQGLTTDDALDSDIFRFYIPAFVADAVPIAVPAAAVTPAAASAAAPAPVPTTIDQRFNQTPVHSFISTGSGPFDDAERCALALTLIEMKGVVDLSTNPRLFLPTDQDCYAPGRRSTAIMTRNLKGIPYRSNGGVSCAKKT